MKNLKYCNVKEILEGTGIVNVKESTKTGGLRFPVYLSPRMEEADIEVLELSVRSYNCMKRAGISTIGELCERIHSSSDLKTIRNCGSTSVAEIMDNLFAYNYNSLKPERRAGYIAKVIEMNSRGTM